MVRYKHENTDGFNAKIDSIKYENIMCYSIKYVIKIR